MSREASADPDPSRGSQTGESMARRRPLLTYLLVAFAIGWPALAVPVITELPSEPFLT